jgi:hypothetical protein
LRPAKTLMMAVVTVATLAFAVAPTTANAVIHSPANGATYQLADTIYFDWTWAPDEYATAWIGFARSPDGPWSPKPEKIFTDSYGTPYLSSHAYLSAYSIGAGTWWWRVCNKSINIEDDRCQFGVDPPQELTIAQAASSLRITSGPPQTTTSRSATFTFDDASRPGAMFDYRLDVYPESWMLLFLIGPDRGSASFSDLSVGTHTFWLVAKDSRGQTSAPLGYTWTIMAPPPPKSQLPAKPRITAHPPKVTRSRSAVFRMSSTTPGVSYKYSLDNPRVLKAGKRPATYRNLKPRIHVFRVQAVKDGKASQIAVFIWKVKR